MSEKVVITGMGAISPAGNNVASAWQNIKNGISGAGCITRFDTSGFSTKIACEIKDFDPSDYMDKKDQRHHDLFTQYSLIAAQEAMDSAGLAQGDYDPDRSSVIFGVGIGGFTTMEDSITTLNAQSRKRTYPFAIPKIISNMAPAQVAIAHQIYGSVYTVTTACTSGADAIAHATQMVRSGIADMVIAGGAEAPITPLGIAGFNALHALSSAFNDQPQRASRPFDALRDGFVIGEGAAVLIVESERHAHARNANILAEIIGCASTNDAYHFTAPHAEGRGIIHAMELALKDASIEPHKIDYINAHGTSTKINDRIETAVIKNVFGSHVQNLKISSTKSMHGHMLGATGVMEVLICVMAAHDGFVPPTINYENADPECDLDYVPNVGVSCPVEYALSSSLGFGGHNGVIIIRRA